MGRRLAVHGGDSKLADEASPLSPLPRRARSAAAVQAKAGMSRHAVPPLLDGFDRVKHLGDGQTGAAYEERDKATGEVVAVKYILRTQVTDKSSRELLNHYLLVHPNIVGFRRALLTPAHLCIVMELTQHGDLIQFVLAQREKRASEAQARAAVAQILAAVQHAHAAGIAHRDLKLCNTLLAAAATPGSVPVVKVCDLGYSKRLSKDTLFRTGLGTGYYMAPELYVQRARSEKNLPALAYDGPKVDVWAIGICLLVLCKGNYPYPAAKGQDAAEGARLAASGLLVSHVHEEVAHLVQYGIITPECQRVMLRCLQEKPEDRPSAAELAADPWFTQHGPYPQAVGFGPPQQSEADLLAIIAQLAP